MQHLDFNTIFYGYTFVYIATRIASAFKKIDTDLDKATEFGNFDFNNPTDALANIKSKVDTLKELTNKKKKSVFSHFSFILNLLNTAWVIYGLSTPHSAFFIAIIVCNVLLYTSMIVKMFVNHSYDTTIKMVQVCIFFELCAAILIAYNHFLVN